MQLEKDQLFTFIETTIKEITSNKLEQHEIDGIMLTIKLAIEETRGYEIDELRKTVTTQRELIENMRCMIGGTPLMYVNR